MTREQAEKTANILIGAAAVGAALFVLGNPAVRRVVWRLARTAIMTTGPLLAAEARRAWTESSAPRQELS